jgi:hypothetical protein
MREADGLKGKKMKVYDTMDLPKGKENEAFRHLSAHFLLSSMLYVIL